MNVVERDNMDEELQRLCDFFERLNKKEDGRVASVNENRIIREEDVSLENIEKFDEFIRKSGGHTGGWGTPEHAVFLKLLRKGNIRNVIPLLRSRFPDISEDDIIEHNTWYTKYVALKSKREHTLRYWRMNQRKTEKLERDEERESNVRVKNRPKMDENIKLKIQLWKEEQRKVHEEALRKQKYEQRMKEEQEKLRTTIHENKKKMVDEYKREKESLDTALKVARQLEKVEQQKVKASRANKMLSKFRKKDKKLIQNARLRKQSKLLKEQEKRELLELIAAKSRKHIRVGRDPIRLLVPTIEWRQKMRNTNSFHADFAQPLNDRPAEITNIKHLATPKWRKDLINDPLRSANVDR